MGVVRSLMLGLVVGMTPLTTWAQQPVVAAAPGLTVEKNDLDLGSVMEGIDAVATFQLRNTTAAEIKILKAAPS